MKSIIDEIGGKVLVIGTPAEENFGGKISMVNANVFDDVDIAMMIHPRTKNGLGGRTQALNPLKFEFFGKNAHGCEPQQGRSALDAAVLSYININLLRQFAQPHTSIYGIVRDGGTAANIIPDYAPLEYYFRGATMKYVKELSEKAIKFSEGYSREDDDRFQGILMKKGTAEKFKFLDDIKKAKLKIGAQKASIQAELAADLTSSDKIKLLVTLDVLAMSLNAGDIDAVVVSTSSAEPLKFTFTDLLVLPKESFNLDPTGIYAKTYVGLPLGEEYKFLVKIINEVIKENTNNGNLERWVSEAKAKMDFQVE